MWDGVTPPVWDGDIEANTESMVAWDGVPETEWEGVTEAVANTESMMLRSAWYGYNIRPMEDCSSHQSSTLLFEGTYGNMPFVIKIASPGHEHEADTNENIDDERTCIENFGDGHPNIMSLLCVPGFTDKYFIMPRLGVALDKLITVKSHATITNTARSVILRDICAAMAFIVSHGMVHGDINLRNIVTTPTLKDMFGRVVVTDFGFCEQARKVVMGDILQMTKYSQSNAVWLQAVNDTYMYATDAIQFVKYVVCPLLGVTVRPRIRNDVMVSMSGVTMGPLDVACPVTTGIFRQSVSDMMLLSDIDVHRENQKVINPLRVVTRIPRFVTDLIKSRISPTVSDGECFMRSSVLAETFKLLVAFPRTLHRGRASDSWTAFGHLYAFITTQ